MMEVSDQAAVKDQDTFFVWQPDTVGLLKSSDDKWKIGGFASTEDLDRQGESVLQKGLDFSEFTEYGYYNDNHQQHTAAVVGVPELAEFRAGKGWWTEGYLLKDVPRAQEIYRLAKALDGESDRKLGFSIEGKILERAGNKIVKALIRNVAITNSPVNTECVWSVLSKSFATDLDLKALNVGHARSPSNGGRVLVPEDIEHDEVKYLYRCPHCSKAFGSTGGLEEHLVKSHMSAPISGKLYPSIRRSARELTCEEAISFIQRIRPEYGAETAARLVEYVFKH